MVRMEAEALTRPFQKNSLQAELAGVCICLRPCENSDSWIADPQ